VKDRYKNCLRMNCGIPWAPAIEAALETLGRLARAQL
jgi:DNA-binding transcriptional MocR family regulator